MLMRPRVTAGPALAAAILALALFLPSLGFAQTPAKLLISQVETRGSGTTAPNEYIVIKNPGSAAVDLSNYYLTDATFASGSQYYYNLPNASLPIGGGTFTDFVARFPEGATIQPGQELSISVLGSSAFQAAYAGKLPNFELFEDGASADDVPDMRPARPGSIKDPGTSGTAPTLSNASEVVILFYWDGASDLVTDIDYLLWGTASSAGVDKTGISIDGPDADSTPTAYNADTPIASQSSLIGNPTGTYIRVDDNEGTQVATGGNGVGGRNEMSENLATTFTANTTGVPPGQTSSDTTPPTLVSATGASGATSVSVVFSEALGTGATTAANYSVYPTATPASTIAVSSASLSGSTVTLTLGSPLAASTAYTVKVSNVKDTAGNTITANSTVAFTTGGGGGFSVTAAFQFGKDYVGVAFSEKVNAAQATTAANYSFTPSLAIASITMQENGQTAIIKTSAALPKSTAYALTVSGVTSLTGSALSGGTANFSTVAEDVTNIATIQTGASGYDGQTVTVIGQVFVTASSNGTTGSAFIQDGSGRGLNVFGGAIQSALDNRGNVAKVAGTVDLYFTTTEVVSYTATLLASGVPRLAPKVLSVAQVKSSDWEGTYIQTTTTLSAAPSASGSSNYNYPAGDITFRVRNLAGLNAADYKSGDVVTAAGFGSEFSGTYQIGVAHGDDFSKGSGPGDTTPPTLVSASGASASTSVSVVFSEALGTGATAAANYSVYPTAAPSSTITVNSAALSGSTVTLTLASPLAASTAYTVKVSNVKDTAGNTIAANSTVAFTSGGGSTGSLTVKAAFQFGADYVGVAFSEKVNAAQATTAANYSFTPSLAIASITMQDNGQTAILKTSSALPASTSYSLTVSGVTTTTGGALSNGSASFSTTSGTVLNIATIQANPGSYDGQSVTVVGQVYVTAGSNGSTGSAFIQDGSGRGLNVFGGAVQSALNDRGNIAKVSGTVDVYFTTTEIVSYTATLLASGVPRLAPKVLTVEQVKSSDWEGTYIQTTATLSAAPSASGSSNYNYPAGDITFRVRNLAGVNAADFKSGDVVTAAGFGSAFGSGSTTTYQIGVAHGDEFTKGGANDTTPPSLASATGSADSRNITLMFSEALGTGANVAANYTVYPTATPAATITVSSASLATNQVTLTLASALVGGTAYTVAVSNVQDLAGNAIAAGSIVQFTAGAAPPEVKFLDVPARTLLRGYVTPGGTEQAISVTMKSQGASKATCRIFDLQGRLVKVLYDGVGADRTLKWNGRDETFEFVRAGLYICHLMTTSVDGTIRREQVPIVVSVRLD